MANFSSFDWLFIAGNDMELSLRILDKNTSFLNKFYEEQCYFQNNEKTMERSNRWIMTG